MTFEEMKKIVVDTLNCEEDKVTMDVGDYLWKLQAFEKACAKLLIFP